MGLETEIGLYSTASTPFLAPTMRIQVGNICKSVGRGHIDGAARQSRSVTVYDRSSS